MTTTEQQTWEQLSRFESNDYVSRWYEIRHRRKLNSTRTSEIISYFDQGKEYFQSASKAATTVRPLLLYYGVLALSRGTILLLNSRMQESSMAQSHGLEVVDWRGTFSNNGIANSPDLKIHATKGTFRELSDATRNREIASWLIPPEFSTGIYHHEFDQPEFIAGGVHISLDDILSRDPRLLTLYSETMGRSGRVYIGRITAHGDKVDVDFIQNRSDQNLDGLVAGRRIGDLERRRGLDALPIPNRFFTIQSANLDVKDLKNKLPMVWYETGRFQHIIEDFPNGDKLSSILRMFLLSYCLGMLVRYFPSRWRALTQNQSGDIVQPLLLASINNLQAHFPARVLQALA